MAEKVKTTKGTKIQMAVVGFIAIIAILAGLISFLDTPSSKKKSTHKRPTSAAPF